MFAHFKKYRFVIDVCGSVLMLFIWMYIYVKATSYSEWLTLYPFILLGIFFSWDILNSSPKITLLSAPYVAYLYLIFTLFGFIVFYPIFPEIKNIRSATTMAFLSSRFLVKAIAISFIFVLLYSLSCVFFANLLFKKTSSKVIGKGLSDLAESSKRKHDFALCAIPVLGICVLFFWLYGLMHPSMFHLSYGDRTTDTSSDSIFIHATYVMALSVIIIFATGNKKEIVIGACLFACAAGFHFLIGNRGEIYYPLLACIAVYVKRKGTFKRKTIITGVIFSLLLITLVRTLRSSGSIANSAGAYLLSISPLESIAEAFGEMGFQIGTIVYLLEYLSFGGIFQWGYTYLYSIQNFFSKYLPFIHSVDANSPAAIKTIMPTDYFAFTNVGEVYFNFGILGVIFFGFLFSYFLCKAAQGLRNMWCDLFIDMCIYMCLLLIRNTTASLMVNISWMIVLLIFCNIFSKFVECIRSKYA